MERHYGDLDDLYDQARLAGTLNAAPILQGRREAQSTESIQAQDRRHLHKTLPAYRGALKSYRDFREAAGETTSSQGSWDEYLRGAEQTFDDGALDRDEGYKSELADAVPTARSSLLTDSEDWPQRLKDAISHRKNNLIDGREYAEGRESNQGKFVGWVDQHSSNVRRALLEMWADDDRAPGDS